MKLLELLDRAAAYFFVVYNVQSAERVASLRQLA